MIITNATWQKYIKVLRRLSDDAAKDIEQEVYRLRAAGISGAAEAGSATLSVVTAGSRAGPDCSYQSSSLGSDISKTSFFLIFLMVLS